MKSTSPKNSAVSAMSELDAAWNRFWFTPSDLWNLCFLRIFVGLATLYFLLSFNSDLARWFGSAGILPAETVTDVNTAQLNVVENQRVGFRFSYLNYLSTPFQLWTAHVIAIFILRTFTAGLFTRLMNVLTLIVTLAYIHRAPLITGPLEPVLVFLQLYLFIALTGRCLSLDAWRNRGRDVKRQRLSGELSCHEPSISARISWRLIQVHLSGLYLTMALTKLGGDTWWVGQAVWWLIAHTESRLVDFSWLCRYEYLLNAWSHAIVLLKLAFGLLIWNRIARPVLIWIVLIHWVLLALITGMLAFCVIMIVANLAFVDPVFLRDIVLRLNRRCQVNSNEEKQLIAVSS